MSVTLAALREALGLSPTPELHPLPDAEAAVRALPGAPVADVRAAFARLQADSLRPHLPDLRALLDGAQRALTHPQPEAALARWLAGVTGGEVTVRASWGDVVAHAGHVPEEAAGGAVLTEVPLAFERRPVGTLQLRAGPGWADLAALIADLLRLARLQAAAAGAARRRVGERQFEALLAGDAAHLPPGEGFTVAALRLDGPPPRSARAREARTAQLDVLCSVGEGFFYRRGVTCLTAVRAQDDGDVAAWLWPGLDSGLPQGLHDALLNATHSSFRLGVSRPHAGAGAAGTALREATQALTAAPLRGAASFAQPDPLQPLLDSPERAAHAAEWQARLRAGDPDGKLAATLRAYLGHTGPLGALAQELNLHLNTLRYRLRRAEDLLGGQLSDPAFLTRVYLAFHGRPQLAGPQPSGQPRRD
ncbi:PucR family transcriptional regulator [Deinococcus kurensis]|uniref:PucR family transcriptional regulator n=1 Tax=Deinococcus kurensis TaxID=2662757 RepID=UPI0012D32CD9|nr:PucR family transcriptional regulator [Deinococcus kurensis]